MTKHLTHLLLVSLPILCNAQVTQIDLQENITEIKSINISDDDFTGYEVLAKKIGDANIVLLGEQTHGHGTTFIAKTKIIKYLVENHGFDVIAFESGFFEINKIWDSELILTDKLQDVRNEIYSLWSESEELTSFFDYVRESNMKGKKLDLTGFDCKHDMSDGQKNYTSDFHSFLQTNKFPILDDPKYVEFKSILATLIKLKMNFREDASSSPKPDQRKLFNQVLDSIGLTTFRPNTGLTSSTDDRGNSVKYSYDDYRRPLNTFDRNRNVIKRNEYVLQAEVLPSLNPNFSSNTSIYQTDQQIMFTAEANCVGVTYAWLLKNSSATTIAKGNNTAFQYTFTALGQYSLTLTVSSIFGQISYSDNICVNNTLISPQISVTHQASTDPLIEYSCYGNDNNKTFTVTNLPFAPGLVKTFVWLILLPSGSWSEIPDTFNLSSIEHSMGGGSYTIRCIVSVQYPDVSCNENMRIISTSTVQVNITYVNNETCQ